MRSKFHPYEPIGVPLLLSLPGMWEILNHFEPGKGNTINAGVVRIEVAADLTCYQLTETGVRDGVLPPDGWTRPHVYVLKIDGVSNVSH